LEATLYEAVTKVVSEEFNRADNLEAGRRGTIGFALTILQHRLASRDEAIYQSLHRRRERLVVRLREERILRRIGKTKADLMQNLPKLDMEDVGDFVDEPQEEQKQNGEQLIDLMTAARTLHELEIEIAEITRWNKWPTEFADRATIVNGRNSPGFSKRMMKCSTATATAES
jgi:hypothetical protein